MKILSSWVALSQSLSTPAVKRFCRQHPSEKFKSWRHVIRVELSIQSEKTDFCLEYRQQENAEIWFKTYRESGGRARFYYRNYLWANRENILQDVRNIKALLAKLYAEQHSRQVFCKGRSALNVNGLLIYRKHKRMELKKTMMKLRLEFRSKESCHHVSYHVTLFCI